MSTDSESARFTWRPILSGPAAKRALQTAHAIAQDIAVLSPGERDPSLAGGQAGMALLYAWLARAHASPQAGDLAWRCLTRAIHATATRALDSSLYHGFVGVAWAAELVDRLLDPHGEDRNEAVDDAVTQLLIRPGLWPAPHDLVEGVTGVGVYLLERLPRPLAGAALERVVARLQECAVRDAHGTYWWTPAGMLAPEEQDEFPSGVVDLGVAHGTAGAIGFLGALCATGLEQERARPLLEGAVSWLLAQAVDTQAGPTVPIWVAPGFEPSPARSAWCYGDPGVAAALLVAARGAGEPAWEREAVSLARRAAARPAAETGVEDAGLCHGSAGLAHLFNRMYQATGEPTLGQAARYWLGHTLDLCPLPQANGTGWVTGTARRWDSAWTGTGLLDGAAGVALVLLAASTPVEPTWDRMFLVSTPHAAALEAR